MILYKLTDAKGQTRGETQWGVNITHIAKDPDCLPRLCTGTIIHAYRTPIMAVLMNTVHACFLQPRLWEAEGEVAVDDGTKVGCRELTTLKEISLPRMTIEERIEIAVRCAMAIFKGRQFTEWANRWLDRTDRTTPAARDAAASARIGYFGGRYSTNAYAAASAAAAAVTRNEYNCADAIASAASAAAETYSPIGFIEIVEQVRYRRLYGRD